MSPEAIRPWAELTKSEAEAWADGVRDAVTALLDPAQAGAVARVKVKQGDERDSPYGPFLGSWIDPTGPTITVLENWAYPLWLMFRDTPELLAEAHPEEAKRRCRIRLRMGGTNDVWQPFVPGPPSGYSMVRHHALMLAGAWSWLPPEDQREWAHVLEVTCCRAVTRFGGATASVLDQIDDAERNAASVWTAERTRSEAAESRLAAFYLWASVALAVLVQPLSALSTEGQQEQLRRWATDHRRPGFNRNRIEVAWKRLRTHGSPWA